VKLEGGSMKSGTDATGARFVFGIEGGAVGTGIS